MGSGSRLLRCLLLMALVARCVDPERDESRSFIEWAQKAAVPVEQLETTFAEAIGSARVVGIGESRHDTREQLQLKARLVRHLVEDLDFRTLILEESFSHVGSLDRHVTSGEGDAREILSGMAGWYLWDTEEMLELVQWIRTFNAGRPPERQVRVFGMDITAPAAGVSAVLGSLEAASIETPLDARALGLELQQGDSWPRTWERYAAVADERRRELRRSYEDLLEVVRRERTRLVASSSVAAYEQILMMAEVGKSGNEFFSSASREEGGEIREQAMARMALWVLDRKETGDNAIVWAHNLHVARSEFRMPGFARGMLRPMGVQLGRTLGDDYVAIGGAFGTGRYSADLPPGERRFDRLAEETMDGALAAIGVPAFLIDLRNAHDSPDARRWLDVEREWRAQEFQSLLVPGAAFDIVYYVERITRAQPSPAALRRFRESMN